MAGTVQILVNPSITSNGTEAAAPTYAVGTDPQGNNHVGSVGTFAVPGLERVLAPNTTYMLTVTNPELDPQRVSVFVTWYEGKLSSRI